MTGLRYGSLFSGYDGLTMGVQSVLGGTTVWRSDICHIDKDGAPVGDGHHSPHRAPCSILDRHLPDVPNLGNITTIDWDDVEPVDILTGGFPCQDVSHAGRQLGLKPGTRSGLWAHMAYAIDKLRPALVVAENVRGLLSAPAESPDPDPDVEPCAWCVGDGGGSPLRALGAVLGDLADLGYDAQWYGVRASDAGSPHNRFRVFVYAWPATDAGSEAVRLRTGLRASEPARLWRGRPDDDGASLAAADADVTGREGREPARGRHLPARGTPADTQGHGRHEGRTEPARLERGPDAAQRGAGTTTADAEPVSPQQHRDHRGVAGAAGGSAGADGDAARAGAAGGGAIGGGGGAADPGRDRPTPVATWGPYADAIARWERLTRPAPAPTEDGKRGGQRLSPRFVEWMMGLPDGHVTDPVIGLTRNEQLKALGNGVVPQQAALATRLWLLDMDLEVAS